MKVGPSNARRDAIVLATLVIAVLLFIWSGSSLFRYLQLHGEFGPDLQVMSTALTLNVSLILFGWRRYIDLRHEAEMRAVQEQRAVQLASTDSVTGLSNRKGFSDGAEAMCAAAGSKSFLIISFLISRFKTINEQHGYDIGDRLLKTIAEHISDEMPPDSIVARLGGNEFAVALVLPPDDNDRVTALAEAALRRVCRPIILDERILEVGAFAGIASTPAKEAQIPDVLRRAEIAATHAHSGRVARPAWFDSGMERALVAQGEIEQGIRYGLDHAQFLPYFEPQVDLATGKIIAFEVLARWNHPLSGIIGPDIFIPIAEEIGVIGRLSEQVIREALRSAAKWDPSISIAVNISPSQFADGWLAQRIVRLLAETGFPADRLVIEITETSLFADVEVARSIISSLKNQGVRIALDDFGTGFSSLAHLRTVPFDTIKIDRSFLHKSHSQHESVAIIRAVVTLADALSVPVCVEGIENEAALDTVVRLGCAIGQGWYFAKPMTADNAAFLLQSDGRIDAVEHDDGDNTDFQHPGAAAL